jgi:hypothetical protein
MTVHYRFLVMAGLAATSLGLLGASAPAQPNPRADAATQQTVSDIRGVGTAMWHWYKDEVAPKRSESAHEKAEEESHAAAVDFSKVPVISAADLTKVLVPKYIPAIPEKDGWGHPYEFRLNTRDADAINVMAVRSGGQDGRFSGDTYKIGAFPADDRDQDITWIDGYFARWPEKAKPGR